MTNMKGGRVYRVEVGKRVERSDGSFTVLEDFGTHRRIEVDGVEITTMKQEVAEHIIEHALYQDADQAKEIYLMGTPELVAFWYERGLCQVPDETIEIPGLWTVFVQRENVDRCMGTMLVDSPVYIANASFRDL